jgi:hypothetical protein
MLSCPRADRPTDRPTSSYQMSEQLPTSLLGDCLYIVAVIDGYHGWRIQCMLSAGRVQGLLYQEKAVTSSDT